MKFKDQTIQTINDKEFNNEELFMNNAIDGKNNYYFSIQNELNSTCFDRKVLLSTGYKNQFNAIDENTLNSFVINAEDAIKLGQKLIESGTKSLLNLMYDNNLYRLLNSLREEIKLGYIPKVIFKAKYNKPINFTEEYYVFTIKAVYKNLPELSSKNREEFSFDMIINIKGFKSIHELEEFCKDTILLNKDNDKLKVVVHNFNESQLIKESTEDKILEGIDSGEYVAVPVGTSKEELEKNLNNAIK